MTIINRVPVAKLFCCSYSLDLPVRYGSVDRTWLDHIHVENGLCVKSEDRISTGAKLWQYSCVILDVCDTMATGLSPNTMTFETWATHHGIDEQTSKILIENGINSISCVKLRDQSILNPYHWVNHCCCKKLSHHWNRHQIAVRLLVQQLISLRMKVVTRLVTHSLLVHNSRQQ